MNKIIINPKVCDLSPICGGVAVCPTQALQYDKAARKINFDESKCVGCGACVAECPAAALSLARNAEEERQIMAEIDADPRTVEELFVDRYGSTTVDMQPISYAEAIDKTKVVGGGYYCVGSLGRGERFLFNNVGSDGRNFCGV
ncbi:MAG: 4Fe-4S dicluster domain-containing protein [Alphaproteobacteria bacterium]|nr:4Fe-4S dicluster domain-containing protein [Alphaproteobacteria bacterium]